MIRCKELNQVFSTKKEMFKALKAAKTQLIDAKKAAMKFTDPIGFKIGHAGSGFAPIEKHLGNPKELGFGDYVYPVINTINFLDSHSDVHLWGIWDKSAKEQNGKIYYIINHDLSIGKVISYPKDVEIMVKEMTWQELGQSFAGKTQALIFKSKLTDASNEDAYKAIKNGEDIQNSVRMMYVRLELAINSTEEYYKEEKAVWDKYSPVVVNREALDNGYFWAIHEAKIYMEGSAVLFGSNSATPVLTNEPKNIGPSQDTRRAVKDTRTLEALKTLSNFSKQ